MGEIDKTYQKDEFTQKRIELDILFFNTRDYDKSLKETNEFLEFITNEKDKRKVNEYNFFYANMHLSKIYNRLNNKRMALAHVFKARRFKNRNDISHDLLVNWQKARCYRDLDNNESLKYLYKVYDTCANYQLTYPDTMKQYMSGILDEIGAITNDEKMILRSINIYESINCTKIGLDIVAKTNEIDEKYENIFNIYLSRNECINAYKILHKVKNKVKRIDMKNKLNDFLKNNNETNTSNF